VVGRTLFPTRVKEWGTGDAKGWKRPFVIAEKHPVWGAEMAEEAGSLPLVVSLIRRHQDCTDNDIGHGSPGDAVALEEQLLFQLQLLDDES
jgi:hypothetical protein